MAITEPTANNALAAVLRDLRKVWSVPNVIRSENTGHLKGAKRPDILIMEPGTSPLVLETEFLPAQTVEKDACSRLGQTLLENGKQVLSSVAVRLPANLRNLEGKPLDTEIRNTSLFQIACFTGRSPDDVTRWPTKGWVNGTVRDLAFICQSLTTPPDIVAQAADRLVAGVSQAAGMLDELALTYPGAATGIAATLKQEDGTQTRRMAMTILANAFVFHASLVGQGGELADVRSVQQLRGSTGTLTRAALLDEWRKILAINYWPIFDIARQIVELIPASGAGSILGRLSDTADEILESGLSQSHDLVGAIFQELIAARKFLAAFYTRPASAMLLTGLALSPDQAPGNKSWASRADLEKLRFADFACGTGTLLSALYRLTRHYHELNGGDEAAIHPAMMANVLVGCDIMPAAAHITASMLSGAHPSVKYGRSSIMTMPYGWQASGDVTLGALDLLAAQGTFPLLATHASAIGGKGTQAKNTWETIADETMDLVIMNPPFTRATNHEGNKFDIPNPMFAAFSSDEEEQKAMAKKLQKITRGTAYHGNAGEGSAFLELADRKLATGGTLAMVLPLSLQAGAGWEGARALLCARYSALVVVNIAAQRDDDASFSADTGMAECLIVGKKTGEQSERATFVILARAPANSLEGAMFARVIGEQLKAGKVRKLEDGPVGGTAIRVGDDALGWMVEGPLLEDGRWPISRVADVELAQTAYQLIQNQLLWLPSTAKSASTSLPICRISQVADVGPLHRDINGTERSGGLIRGPFDIIDIGGGAPTYPTLWNHDAEAERTMLVKPDSQAVLRTGKSSAENASIAARAAKIWSSASSCHFNYDFRFNSQSTSACYTEMPTIGGRAWPALSFPQAGHEKAFVLWANTTLGLLCHWWHANKQQSGRGSITLTAIPNTPTFDLRTLSASKLAKANKLFDEFAAQPLRPFNEVDSDPVRATLDHAALTVFGVPEVLLTPGGPLDLLRRKLAKEPSITGGKKLALPMSNEDEAPLPKKPKPSRRASRQQA